MKPPKEQNPPPKLERYTAQQSGSRLWITPAIAFAVTLYALRELLNHHWLFGSALSFVAVFRRLAFLPYGGSTNRKNGVEIYALVQPTAQATQVPIFLAILVTGAFTLFVAVASIGSFLLFRTLIVTVTGMMIFCSVNLFLWLMVAFLWYRCLTPVKTVPEPVHTIAQEGVWPPSPLSNEPKGDED